MVSLLLHPRPCRRPTSSLKPLHQFHQIVTTTSLHHLARLPGAIVTKLDNTSNCFELGSYFKQAVASQQANSFA